MIPSEPTSEFTPSGFDFEFAAPSDYARLYRLRGIQVVPAWMPGEHKSWKRPLLDSWKDFQEALVDDETFVEWYGAGGKYVMRPNMGVITGRASSNLFVIDLDHHKNSAAATWWNVLMSIHNNGMELETVEQRTGGGGSQKLFRAPPEWTAPTNKTPMGVDIRGQGGFAMLAPSLHESGKTYEWLEGQSPDDIPVTMAPDWLLEAVEVLVAHYGGGVSAPRKTNGQAPLEQYDGFGSQIDGRETYMRDMVWRVVLDWNAECPLPVSAAMSLEKARREYAVYEREVSPQGAYPADVSKAEALDHEGRGWKTFHVKWQAAMRKWDGDVYREARKPGRIKPEPELKRPDVILPQLDPATGKPVPGLAYPFLDINQIMDKPDPVWMVDDLINERALGFIFGPPSSLKTFLALDLSLSIAAKAPTWWNRKINRHGAVVYLCREGTSSFKFRIEAWELHRKLAARGIPFYLIEHPTNFMNDLEVARAIATIEAIMTAAGVPVAAVVVDTVSRVLPGAEENLQRDMSLFVGACEKIQMRFDCIVIGVHHTNKTGGIRGSSVIPGAGDFLIETRREPGAMTGSIVLQKVKDGEDGVELAFKVTKHELGGIVPRSSLAVDPDMDAKPVMATTGGDLPDMTVCREILAALAQAWFNKMPWCKAPNGDRPAITMIMNRWQLKRDVAKRLIEGWLANGVIEYDYFDKRNRLRGYRKVTDL